MKRGWAGRDAQPDRASLHSQRQGQEEEVRLTQYLPLSLAKRVMTHLLLLLLVVSVSLCTANNAEFKQHNNTELAAVLEQIHNRCPDITRLYTLSEPSVNGIPLYVPEFTDNPGHHKLLESEIKYIGNMHGNEALGRELLLHLADHLCTAYTQAQEDMVRLIDNTRIHLLPTMNPDGWKIATEAGAGDYLVGRYKWTV